MENNVAAQTNLKNISSTEIARDKHGGEDSEDDEDEERDEPVTVTTSVADSCSASHEFEWLSPGYQNTSYSQSEKHNGRTCSSEMTSERQQPLSHEEEDGVTSCQVSPARSAHHRHHKPPHVWPRKSSEINEQPRMSPSPCHELHTCHRHLSPMRSSWCCPSPAPHSVCLHHHGGSMVSGLELVSYNRECYGPDMAFWPCQNCSCLPPTGLATQSRYQESHSWCQTPSPHHEIIRRESSSPCAMHKSCQGPGGSRRSRTSRKRDCLSPLSLRYSPVPGDQTSLRHSGNDQWQVPVHSEDIESLQKIQELETDKKNLLLQASVLADQVDAQADKIIELERLLQQKRDELLRLEQNLHQEIISRSTVENSKLELMTELSNLRLRLTAAERDRKESDDKCRKLEHDLALCQAKFFEKETEYAALRDKLSRCEDRILSNESSELEKLKSALDSVFISNEKDQKLGDLQSSLTRYKKLQDIVLSSHSHLRKTASSGSDSHIFNHESVLCSSNSDALKKLSNDSSLIMSSHTPQSLSAIPTFYDQSMPPTLSSSAKVSPNKNSNSAFHKSSSVENICPTSLTAFPAKSQYGTMPRQTGSQVLQQLQTRLQEHEVDQKKVLSLSSEKQETPAHENNISANKTRNVNGGSSNKSTGVSFAAECITIPVESRNSEHSPDSGTISSQPFFIKSDRDKNKGLLKFFYKQDFVIFKRWKRTGSQNIDRVEGDFKRGGIRATAGPRLGWSRDIKIDPDIPFICWNTDMIVDWLHKLGLSMYISDCKRWMCNGEILSKATSQDLEKELNIKHPLHRKKLLLAIKSMTNSLKLPPAINNIDCEWVFRWLDDVGLPQYKDAFTEALVDGRMLHTMTVEDLLYLKVTSQLHHISIKCGIQVLREKGFDPHCLVRRSLPDEGKEYTPEMVARWTNHRVMEWLRTVDLSEYAPNLRGSGVHGALIVYESKFNTNLFATLLNIPPTKTLLRRHLATHFKHIVGDDLMQIKREKETEIPLSPSVKIKVLRKNQFALKKKRNKSDFDNEDYVCPMDIPVCQDQANQESKASDGQKLVVRRNSDPSPQERHIDLKDEASQRIGPVSKEISSLATIIHGENLSGSPSTIV